MEKGIASNIDLALDLATAPTRSPWIRLIDGQEVVNRPVPKIPRGEKPEELFEGWARFQVAFVRGVTVVRIVDQALIKEAMVREFARDLFDLIEAGNYRVVLNFQAVELLASWVVVAVGEARRRCESADGGALKICGLPQQLASIFPLAGVALGDALHADEAAAIDSAWPLMSGGSGATRPEN
jgi:hypothetical protein